MAQFYIVSARKKITRFFLYAGITSMLRSKSRVGELSVKGKIVNILDYIVHMVSVTTTQLLPLRSKSSHGWMTHR